MIRYFPDLIQGSDEWLAARCGLLTASEMKRIITPTFKIADTEKTRAHVWELLGQRVTKYVEPTYVGDDMMRGKEVEIYAREAYSNAYEPVQEMGFVTNDKWGFTLGYSPDGLVGDKGAIEIKGPRQKGQIQTISEHLVAGTIPDEHIIQIQTGFLVSERQWIDFISYHGGLPMVIIRCYPNERIMSVILDAAGAFEKAVARCRKEFEEALTHKSARVLPTERIIAQEMYAP